MIPLPEGVSLTDIGISEKDVKSGCILRKLRDMHYNAEDERDAVHIIEEQGVDKFDFDYPYGSFEEFKKHVLAGEFDVDIEATMMTDEERAEEEKAIREGRLRVTY